MGDNDSGSSAVSIFAMVLITVVVLIVLYFVVFRGFFGSKKTEVDINVKPPGSYKMQLDKGKLAYNLMYHYRNIFQENVYV
jgi:hypothetical protein